MPSTVLDDKNKQRLPDIKHTKEHVKTLDCSTVMTWLENCQKSKLKTTAPLGNNIKKAIPPIP